MNRVPTKESSLETASCKIMELSTLELSTFLYDVDIWIAAYYIDQQSLC